MDKILEVMYAGSVAASQFLIAFSQVRAEQKAMAAMSPADIKELTSKLDVRRSIGFCSATST